MEVLTIGIFCALLIICIITGKSILYALLAGLIIFSLYGKKPVSYTHLTLPTKLEV